MKVHELDEEYNNEEPAVPEKTTAGPEQSAPRRRSREDEHPMVRYLGVTVLCGLLLDAMLEFCRLFPALRDALGSIGPWLTLPLALVMAFAHQRFTFRCKGGLMMAVGIIAAMSLLENQAAPWAYEASHEMGIVRLAVQIACFFLQYGLLRLLAFPRRKREAPDT
jgi:hypothetical protein